ncbi:MAG: dialkylresorcinol condensing enzyme DarA [Bacteroidetes bacterium]|nr:dialkylresorcinol condensing enzyme DarA [Bacteroidota bacterium]
MPTNILVIYYSQTGQLKNIIDHVFSSTHSCNIDYCEIKPVKKFPFPWTSATFFDCMPECVQQIPEEIEPLVFPDKKYDVVILGYQPWFLSPSIPINSFLQSKYAEILKGKEVITIIGSRNMWLHAQEKVKEVLIKQGAKLRGNIVFFDRNPNLISILTVIRWSFKGIKEATRYLPEAGVQQRDIELANRFGSIILKAIEGNKLDDLHKNLLNEKSVELSPALVILEKRGIANFRKFSKYILAKGNRGDAQRQARVKLFSKLLIIGVFILSPISSLTAKIKVMLNKKSLEAEVDYFKNITFKIKAI